MFIDNNSYSQPQTSTQTQNAGDLEVSISFENLFGSPFLGRDNVDNSRRETDFLTTTSYDIKNDTSAVAKAESTPTASVGVGVAGGSGSGGEVSTARGDDYLGTRGATSDDNSFSSIFPLLGIVFISAFAMILIFSKKKKKKSNVKE